MKKIYFAGLLYDNNLGDTAILKSTEYLYKMALNGHGNISYHHLNLNFNKTNLISRASRKFKRLFVSAVKKNTDRLTINMLKKNYREQLESPDLIVFVGGGIIKYKYQSFHLFITALTELAEELGCPVVINAAGVEGYSETDIRCQLLKKSLNKNIVKSITTRDDIETLNSLYITNHKTHTAKVADPAVYCDEVYQIKKEVSEVFGIGLVRGGIFLDNERDLKPDEIAHFYSELILEMDKQKLKYQLFTNGAPADSELVEQIEKNIGGKNLNVIEPHKDSDLISAISTFKGVVAARLHANIISYALNVPSIGLVWNDKLTLFGADIGYPERFFEFDNLDAKKVVDALVLAAKQGYRTEQWLEYKLTAKSNIEVVVGKWLAGEI